MIESKTPHRADLPNGVVIFARHFPGYGSPAGWEIQIVDTATKKLLDYIKSFSDDEFRLALEMQRLVDRWRSMSSEQIFNANAALRGCPYGDANCGYQHPHRHGDDDEPRECRHPDVHRDIFHACSFCGGDTIGWSRTWSDKVQCWACYSRSSEYNPGFSARFAVRVFPVL